MKHTAALKMIDFLNAEAMLAPVQSDIDQLSCELKELDLLFHDIASRVSPQYRQSKNEKRYFRN